jgi:isoprenylcysteine carboxyl methyltransferase (ICMT) family protein YpbQ
MVNVPEFLKSRHLPLRIMVIALAAVPIIFWEDFYVQFHTHFTGTLLDITIKDQWLLVVLNIVLFLSFLLPLSFRRKINWKEYGLITAFFVSLFVEMYGIPLTVFFASEYISGSSGSASPDSLINFEFLGVDIGMSMGMVYGTVLMLIGMALIMIGWVTLYKNLKDDEIVTKGIYSMSRHPQYLGFILIVFGWLAGWPTILTVIFAPILIFMYVRVSRKEEDELAEIEAYEEYKKEVPFFL